MPAIQTEDVRIVSDAISGTTTPDEKTHRAIQSLQDRLEMLKAKSPLFADIAFSPFVESIGLPIPVGA